MTLGLRTVAGSRELMNRLPDAEALAASWHWNFSGAMCS